MKISGVGRYIGAYPGVSISGKTDSAVRNADSANTRPKTDTVEFSIGAERPRNRFQEEPARTEESAPDGDDTRAAEPEEAGSVSVNRSMGINAGKLARRLAAAKTRSQIRAVIAAIQSDLRECENGRAQGADVDEASVEAAERLLQEARQRMGQAQDREPTPEEEMASALASLF